MHDEGPQSGDHEGDYWHAILKFEILNPNRLVDGERDNIAGTVPSATA